MNTKNIKLIFLTGTPAVNDPFELVSCFNMLKGRLYDRVKLVKLDKYKIKPNEPKEEPEHNENGNDTDSGTDDDESSNAANIDGGDSVNISSSISGGSDYTLLPENREDFENWFVDFETLSIKNQQIFQARLSGLVSYYGPVYFDKGDGVPREFFPRELPVIIKKIPMSTEQYAAYATARDKERGEASRPNFSKAAERFSSSGKSSSTYRVESRQISNFFFPRHALGIPEGLKLPEKLLNKLTSDDLSDGGLAIHSPKMMEVYNDIMGFFNAGKKLGIFYSSFVMAGLKVFAKILEQRGWKAYNNLSVTNASDDAYMENKVAEVIADGGRRRRRGGNNEAVIVYKYAIISGEVDPEDRAEIVRIFNSAENIRGGVIDLLLISSTGVEGLDLKGLRFGIMLEPYWHDARRGQFAARMVRYKSHEHLPEDERDCQLVIYLADYPVKLAAAASAEEKTTDVDLYDESIVGKIILDKFFLSVIEASIDCNIHHATLDPIIKKKISCLLCKPTGKQLYNVNIRHDFEQERPCAPFEIEQNVKSITAKEILVDDKKFFYTYDNEKGLDSLIIYEYNQNLDGHVPIRANNPFYPAIMEKLLAFLV